MIAYCNTQLQLVIIKFHNEYEQRKTIHQSLINKRHHIEAGMFHTAIG